MFLFNSENQSSGESSASNVVLVNSTFAGVVIDQGEDSADIGNGNLNLALTNDHSENSITGNNFSGGFVDVDEDDSSTKSRKYINVIDTVFFILFFAILIRRESRQK